METTSNLLSEDSAGTNIPYRDTPEWEAAALAALEQNQLQREASKRAYMSWFGLNDNRTWKD